MEQAVKALSEKILRFQGDGDREGAERFIAEMGGVPAQLQADLDQISREGMPIDLVFEQGLKVLRR